MIRKSFIYYGYLQRRYSSALNLPRRQDNIQNTVNICFCQIYNNFLPRNMSLMRSDEAKLNEKEFLIKMRNNPDEFGPHQEQEVIDEDDIKEEKYLKDKPLPSSKLSTKKYADIIKKLIKQRKIQEAIDVLEIRMLKEDRVKPENYIYSLLIGACGRLGYTKKAFSLFNNMKKRGLKVHASMYTSLFNACANSPWPESDGLSRAKKLRELMTTALHEPNDSSYNAMIKAFGRCRDLLTAFEIVDEMIAKGHKIKSDTLNFLLQACISDKEAGFRHALLVWQKYIQGKISPDVYSFNLMLRCIRDCQIGDIDTMKEVIDRITVKSDKELNLLESGGENDKKDSLVIAESFPLDPNKKEVSHFRVSPQYVENRPNLMSENPHLGNIISLSEVKTPEDRLVLVGGLNGFIDNMISHGCSPNIKTFTQLLDSIPNTLSAEKELLQNMRKLNVKPDLDFFNMLIKKRSLRLDYNTAREVLTMIKSYKYKPDLVTYGVLALGCQSKDDALALVDEMKIHKYRLNTPIIGAMVKQACFSNNFPYVLELMEICLKENIKPDKKMLSELESFKKKSKKISNDYSNPLSKSESYQKGYKKFKARYKNWLKEVTFDDQEDSHPWQQFREDVKTDVRHFKDKTESSRFKQRRQSLFKKKTTTKVRY